MAAASPHKGAASVGTQLTAIVVEDRHLYAAGVDSSLWRRSIDSRAAEWEKKGNSENNSAQANTAPAPAPPTKAAVPAEAATAAATVATPVLLPPSSAAPGRGRDESESKS